MLQMMLDHGPTVDFDALLDHMQVDRVSPSRAITEPTSKLRRLVRRYFKLGRLGYRGPRTIAIIPNAPWPVITLGDEAGGTTPCPCCSRLLAIPSYGEIAEAADLTELEDIAFAAVWAGGVDRDFAPGFPVTSRAIIDAMFVDDPDGGLSSTAKEYEVLYRTLRTANEKLAPFGVLIDRDAVARGYRMRIARP